MEMQIQAELSKATSSDAISMEERHKRAAAFWPIVIKLTQMQSKGHSWHYKIITIEIRQNIKNMIQHK